MTSCFAKKNIFTCLKMLTKINTLFLGQLHESPKCDDQNPITKNQPIILEMDKYFWNEMELGLSVADYVNQAEFGQNKQHEKCI